MNEATKEATQTDILSEIKAMNASINGLAASFDASSKTVQSGLRMVYLVPMAVVFFGVSTWLLFLGKITEYTWIAVFVCLATPFFGEGIRTILDRVPLFGNKSSDAIAAAQKTITLVGLVALILSLFFKV